MRGGGRGKVRKRATAFIVKNSCGQGITCLLKRQRRQLKQMRGFKAVKVKEKPVKAIKVHISVSHTHECVGYKWKRVVVCWGI